MTRPGHTTCEICEVCTLDSEVARLRARVGILTGALEYATRFFGSGSFAMAGVGEVVEVMRAALGVPGGEQG